uniref:Uncharacterized protein n=1 Tax=Hucho hucho TaxID=62062 RepID=A0A4W5RFE5_9TELE
MDPPPFYEEGKSTPEEKIRPGEVDCDICSEVQAVKFCQTCSVTYCETHIRQHYTVPKLQKHTLVDVTRDLVQKLCHHDYSPLEVFCRTDQMLICSQCAETNHKGHDTTLLETKKAGRQSCDGDQHTMLLSDDVLPPPGDIQVLLLTFNSVSLSWSSPQWLTGPQTFRVTWGCDSETSSTRVEGGHQLEISSLQPGEKYQFSVATEGEDGRQSRWVSASLSTVLPAPDQLTVDSVDTTSAAVSWSQPPGLDQTQHHYQISYHCPGTEPHITTTSSHSITLSDLQGGTQYFVTVCTVLENGKQSQLVSTTLTTIPPAPDQLTVDSVNTTSAAVSWSQPPGLDQTQHHYQISYRCPGTEPHITTTPSHSITLSDLQPATEYSVTVCTVLENGKHSQLVSTTLTTVHFQWGKRPSRVAAVCVLLALIIGLWDSYATAERDQLQNSLNTRTTERDQLQNSLNTRTTERDQLQNSLNTRTTEIDKLIKSLNTTTMERDQLQKEIERLNWENKGSCPEGWRRFGCRCYYLSTEKKSWEKSRQDCLERGADLVIINSEEEQTFINGFKSVSYVWIGLTDSVTEGTWKWVDDTPLTSPKYWWSGEPGGGTYQNCGEIYYISSGQGVWRDLGCSFSQEWICEK